MRTLVVALLLCMSLGASGCLQDPDPGFELRLSNQQEPAKAVTCANHKMIAYVILHGPKCYGIFVNAYGAYDYCEVSCAASLVL